MWIETAQQMMDEIERIGFLPYCGSKKGLLFTLEKRTQNPWFTGRDNDPWEWRHVAAQSEKAAYGKFFLGSTGFVAKENIPAFIALRRHNKSARELFSEGLLSRRAKTIYDCFDLFPFLDAVELKERSGLEKGDFDAGLTELQMLFLLCISGYTRKKNKKGEPYGWSINEYARMETVFGDERMEEEEAVSTLLACGKRAGEFTDKEIMKLVKTGSV